ncbi:hypothetical protein AX16_005376 [Volvariella volvacea WC 439]|nr:hypothetical protein AX16_005376 [Volvariella volvacea WC 439]
MAAAESKKRSWTAKYIPRPGNNSGRGSKLAVTISGQPGGSSSKFREPLVPLLATPIEGQELDITSAYTTPAASRRNSPTLSTVSLPPVNNAPVPSNPDPPPVSRPHTPRRWSSSLILTPLSSPSSPQNSPQELDNQASQLILNALERTNSAQTGRNSESRSTFGKMSFSSMMGGLSSLSLSRTNTNNSITDEKESSSRGRSMFSGKRVKSASQAPTDGNDEASRSRSRARSQSPFMFRRFRQREPSPTPQPLPMAHSDAELSDSSSYVRPRTAFADDPDSGDETVGETEDEDDSLGSDEEEAMDPITERNTEHNALIVPVPGEGPTGFDGEADIDPDPLGEGVNVVVPPEPYFPTTLNYTPGLVGTARAKRNNPRRRKSLKHHEPLPYETSRPLFQRDRCTITITQGDPDAKLGGRRRRRYVVASDLSEESRYAVEWGIGTVLRDGDEMFIVNVVENEARIDPPIPNAADRANKLRSQQERQGLAYILVRQATSLLQRTKLNVIVSCQAWHAKNARHMLLDIVDYVEPVMLIVGSRGLGQLKGILLGSTSHYLIEKSPVPVMIARRRLKRPPRRSAHLSKHRAHVSLAEAGIDRVAAKVDQDVKVMRDAIQRDDERRDGGPGSRDVTGMAGVAEDHEVEGEDDDEPEDTGTTSSPVDVKVSG